MTLCLGHQNGIWMLLWACSQLICDCQILTSKWELFLFFFCICLYALMLVFGIWMYYLATVICTTRYGIFLWMKFAFILVLLSLFRPELFSWDKITKMSPVERLENAFNIAKNHLGIEKLLDPEGGIQLFYSIGSVFELSVKKFLLLILSMNNYSVSFVQCCLISSI